jgi:NitT/TauT family transport system permease protein/sulfonate transport system permease protein
MSAATRKNKLLSASAPLASAVIFLLLWQTAVLFVGTKALPSPVMVLNEGIRLFSIKIGGNSLWMHVYYSMKRVLIAYFWAGLLGLPLGIFMGWNRTCDKIVKPVFELLRPIPPIAWIPIAILWLGIGEGPKIFICFVGSFVIFVLNSYIGMRYVDTLLIDAARAFGASNRQQLFNVAIPASLPSVFAGVQNALSMSWMCVLAAEMVGGREGVGFIIIQGMDLNKPAMIIVGMALIGLIGAGLAVILRLAERGLCPWRKELI